MSLAVGWCKTQVDIGRIRSVTRFQEIVSARARRGFRSHLIKAYVWDGKSSCGEFSWDWSFSFTPPQPAGSQHSPFFSLLPAWRKMYLLGLICDRVLENKQINKSRCLVNRILRKQLTRLLILRRFLIKISVMVFLKLDSLLSKRLHFPNGCVYWVTQSCLTLCNLMD